MINERIFLVTATDNIPISSDSHVSYDSSDSHVSEIQVTSSQPLHFPIEIIWELLPSPNRDERRFLKTTTDSLEE